VTEMRSTGWLDRLFGATLSLLMAALALYIAAELIMSVWRILIAFLLLSAVAAGLEAGVRNGHSGW
jgi:hypothetical protein